MLIQFTVEEYVSQYVIDANMHICRDKTHFVGDIQPCTTHNVATIGGREDAPTGVDTVRWSWFDDEGVRHKFLVEDVLYFP